LEIHRGLFTVQFPISSNRVEKSRTKNLVRALGLIETLAGLGDPTPLIPQPFEPTNPLPLEVHAHNVQFFQRKNDDFYLT